MRPYEVLEHQLTDPIIDAPPPVTYEPTAADRPKGWKPKKRRGDDDGRELVSV
jgi:hypothetical protein